MLRRIQCRGLREIVKISVVGEHPVAVGRIHFPYAHPLGYRVLPVFVVDPVVLIIYVDASVACFLLCDLPLPVGDWDGEVPVRFCFLLFSALLTLKQQHNLSLSASKIDMKIVILYGFIGNE